VAGRMPLRQPPPKRDSDGGDSRLGAPGIKRPEHAGGNMADLHALVGTDGSEPSLQAVEWAAMKAAARGWRLRIACAPELLPRMTGHQYPRAALPAVADRIRAAAEQALATAAKRAAEIEPGVPVTTQLLSGAPAPALCEAAAGAAMLVVGSRGGGGFAALVLGSVSRYAAFAAPCPVVVARQETMAVHRQVVVGVRDLDQPVALEFAIQAARLRGARLHVVHAWPLFLPAMRLTGTERPGADASEVTAEAAGWLAELMRPWRKIHPDLEIIEDVAHGGPSRLLTGASARADLLVLGRNRDAAASVPPAGTVTHAVLAHAHCPVAVVPE
jgi:nucleotide-binding universal stress UspA family protein